MAVGVVGETGISLVAALPEGILVTFAASAASDATDTDATTAGDTAGICSEIVYGGGGFSSAAGQGGGVCFAALRALVPVGKFFGGGLVYTE